MNGTPKCREAKRNMPKLAIHIQKSDSPQGFLRVPRLEPRFQRELARHRDAAARGWGKLHRACGAQHGLVEAGAGYFFESSSGHFSRCIQVESDLDDRALAARRRGVGRKLTERKNTRFL